MTPAVGEQDYDFCLRVEQRRRALGIPADTVYYAMVAKLGDVLRGELDSVRRSRKANK